MIRKNIKFNKRKLEKTEDFHGFFDVLTALQDLDNRILEKATSLDPFLQNHLLDYVIIRNVTLIENGFRQLIQNLINYREVDLKILFHSDQIEIPISELPKISQKNISTGEIVASNFNLQNLYIINSVLSKIFKLDFFITLKEILNKKENHDDESKKLIQNWDSLKKFFEIRNDIVHYFDKHNSFRVDEMKNFISLSSILLQYSEMLIDLINEIDQKDQRLAEQKEFERKKQELVAKLKSIDNSSKEKLLKVNELFKDQDYFQEFEEEFELDRNVLFQIIDKNRKKFKF